MIATLDIEASGIHAHAYPIEIGISLPDGKTWCSLIKPVDAWTYWSTDAENIHGISREELFTNGKGPKEVAETLNTLLENSTVYSDCWVLDKPWLIQLFQQAGVRQTFNLVDMMYLMQEENYERLSPTKNQIASDLNLNRHRASNDARILQLAYENILSNPNQQRRPSL